VSIIPKRRRRVIAAPSVPLPAFWRGLPLFRHDDPNLPQLARQDCPHCGQKFVAYNRSVGISLCSALALLEALRAHDRNPHWSQQPTYFAGDARAWWPSAAFSRDYHGERISGGPISYLRLFGLVESKDKRGNDGVGLYTITDFGTAFVHQRAKIPKVCVEVRQNPKHYVGPMVGFSDCLNMMFSYNDLMRAAGLL
jgi:hypothetical protein